MNKNQEQQQQQQAKYNNKYLMAISLANIVFNPVYTPKKKKIFLFFFL